MHQVAAFLVLSVLVILAPGPDTAVVTRNALRHGRRAAIRTSLGVSTGLLCWTLASAVGIAALLQASATVFDLLRVAGAVYLVVLGVQSIVASRRSAAPPLEPAAGSAAAADGDRVPSGAFRQGLLSNVLNPKIGVFFTSFLPQFVAPGAPILAVTLLLGFVFTAIALSWLLIYSILATRLGDVLRRPSVHRWLERATGAVLIGFGVRLALERR